MNTPHRHAIHIINGPNMNALGKRPGYGPCTLDELNADLQEHGNERGIDVHFFQTNSEGDLIDYLFDIDNQCCGIILNPGAFGHTSLALADCLASMTTNVVEVHMTNLYARPDRPLTITGAQSHGVVMGFGTLSYFMALDYIANVLRHEDEEVEESNVVPMQQAPTIN